MDYINYQNPSFVQPMDFLNRTTETPPSVRTVEPNRSETESTEQRLFGAYRNTDRAIRELTPDSTQDAPLIYPLMNTYNADEAQELNSQTNPPVEQEQFSMPEMDSIPMPNFTTATRTRAARQPELYTPLGDKTAPMVSRQQRPTSQPYSYTPRQNSTGITPQNTMNRTNNFAMYNTPDSGYPNLTTEYQLNNEGNMYLPTRQTPYYNMPMEQTETMNDFEATEKDMEYLRQMYPAVWRLIQNEIDEECDKLEYEGSCMFDEYPDRVTLDRIIHRIYDRVKDYEDFKNYSSPTPASSVSANQLFFSPCPGCNWIEDFTRIMFLNEISNRRRRYRSRRHWFY